MSIRISWWWLFFLPLFFYHHMGKTLFFLFLMLSLHEAMHMLVAYGFGYPIEGVIVYPFGLCAKMKYLGMGSIWKECLIILAGPSMHLLFPFLFQFFAQLAWISNAYMDYLCALNRSILIFNLLPIFPLDGGRLMQSLYHLFFRYTNAQRLTFLSSICNLSMLLYYRILTTPSALLVMGFLLFQIIMAWSQLAYERRMFYRYRQQHPSKARIKANRKQDLFRAYTNMMATKQGWIQEEDWLHIYFHDTSLTNVTSILL